MHPPSIFIGCPDSCRRQTLSNMNRNVEMRQLSIESKNAQQDEINLFDQINAIGDWDFLKTQIHDRL